MNRTALSLIVPLAGLVACTSEPASIEKPTGGKADEIERLCEALNEPSTCDPCNAAGWYGDGVCDDFCAMPDAADCPAPTSTLASFLAATNHVTSMFEDFISVYQYRFVATDLTQGTADAWTETKAALIGDGHALHLKMSAYPRIDAGGATFAVDSSVSSAGGCSTYYSSYHNGGVLLDVVKWQGAVATRVACTVGGSVRARKIAGTPDRIELTFNVQFSDGTTWIDRTLSSDID